MRLTLLGWCLVSLLLADSGLSAAAKDPLPSGESQIRAPLAGSEIVISTTSRLAGAIDSLTWNGREFIDSADHGRQLQSASNFDFAGQAMVPETFNPTEAGSVADGAGPTSSSRLLHLIADGNRLQTTTQMAFWLPPGGNSQGNPARNQTILSNHLLTKRVHIGWNGLPQVISYQVTFGLPIDEHHEFAQFEILTGYMPPEFSEFYTFDPATGETVPLTDGPGEQPLPVIFATPDRNYAMACYTPEKFEASGWTGPGYGRFRFEKAKVVKWNCVARYRNQQGIRSGDYSFQVFVVVGNWKHVVDGLHELTTAD